MQTMSLADFIGFIIGFLALFFIFVRRKIEERKLPARPEHGQTLDEFLKSMEGEEDEKETPVQMPLKLPKKRIAMPTAIVKQKPAVAKYKPHVEEYKSESATEKRLSVSSFDKHKLSLERDKSGRSTDAYEVIQKSTVSRGQAIVNRIKSQQDMLIYKEIFGRPLSMRDNNSPDKEWQP